MIHGVVARRGIEAIHVTHENRYEITDMLKGRLRQRARIDPNFPQDSIYSFEIYFKRHDHEWKVVDGQWILLSPEGFVAIMDDADFRAWFETASLSDAQRLSAASRALDR